MMEQPTVHRTVPLACKSCILGPISPKLLRSVRLGPGAGPAISRQRSGVRSVTELRFPLQAVELRPVTYLLSIPGERKVLGRRTILDSFLLRAQEARACCYRRATLWTCRNFEENIPWEGWIRMGACDPNPYRSSIQFESRRYLQGVRQLPRD
jgi:hypothetical protein